MGDTKHEAREVFMAALAMNTPEERARYLDEACRDKPELRRRVEALLHANDQAGDFLEQTVPMPPPSDLQVERTGMMIGRYKLLEEIGEGGFGQVYMAEQREPVHRKVALKIIKAGMDTKEVIARFEAERQALALMDHPNIARVFDGGVTQAGRPYFVMELVQGISITQFCDERNLSTDERLELFMQVCQAVQHAHQKGIIHRDLKPSNILVTLVNGEPSTKIIDFGVAKALGQQLTDKTLFTGFLRMVGTPAYMSPEQADLSGVDIDTRADIYALGVLLYELLTSVTPFDAETLRNAALDEVRRMIRETDPPKPSTRLHTMGQKLTEVAKHRHAEPSALSRLVRGDLDWIVMRCLEKDRRRRYETANGLLQDIRRHLEHQPVLASPPSAGYRARKFIRRHRVGVGLTAAVSCALVLGLALALVGFAQAKRARDQAMVSETKAIEEAAKATATSDFLQEMLQSADPDEHRGLDYTVRELLDDFSESLSDQFADQPEVKAALHATMGRAYWRLALGEKALAHHQEALALGLELYGSNSTEVAESHLGCAWALHDLTQSGADLEQAQSHAAEAVRVYRGMGSSAREGLVSALWIQQRLLCMLKRFSEADAALDEASRVLPQGVDHPTLACMLATRANGLVDQGRYREAEPVGQQALAMHRRTRATNDLEIAWTLRELARSFRGQGKIEEEQDALTEALSIFSQALHSQSYPITWTLDELAGALESSGDLRELEALLRQRLSEQRASKSRASAVGGDQGAAVISTLTRLADTIEKQDRYEEAEALYREVLEIQRNTLGDEHLDVADSLAEVGWLCLQQGKLAEVEEVYREALAISRKVSADDDAELAHGLHGFARKLLAQGRMTEAESVANDALTLGRRLLGNEHLNVAHSLLCVADVLYAKGELAETEEALREAVEIRRKLLGSDHQEVGDLLGNLAGVLREQGKSAEAVNVWRREVALRKDASGGEHPSVARALRGLAQVLEAQKKPAEAEQALREALEIRRKLLGNEHPDVVDSLSALSRVLAHQGKLAEAETVQREALAIRRKTQGDEDLDIANALAYLAILKWAQSQPEEAEALHHEALAMRKRIWTEKAKNGTADDLNAVAWLLATCDDASLQDGTQAVAYSERAVEMTSRKNPSILDTLAAAYAEVGQFTDAVKVQQEATDLLENDEQKLNFNYRLRFYESNVAYRAGDSWQLREIGDALRAQNKPAEAETIYREALALQRKTLGNSNRQVALSLNGLGLVLEKQDKLAEAEAVYREALAIFRERLPDDHDNLAVLTELLGRVLRDQGKLSEAESTYREALAIRRRVWGDEHSDVAGSLVKLAITLHAQGKLAEAGTLLDEAFALGQKLSGHEQLKVFSTLGYTYGRMGDTDNALAHYSKVLELKPADEAALYICALLCVGIGDTNRYQSTAQKIVAQLGKDEAAPNKHLLHWACALAPEALTDYSVPLEAAKRAIVRQTNDAPSVSDVQTLGTLLYRADRYTEAAQRLTEAYQLSQRAEPSTLRTSPAYGAYFAAMTHAQLGHSEQASEWFQRASELDPLAKPNKADDASNIPWNRRLTLQLLRGEAESRLNPDVPNPMLSSPTALSLPKNGF